MSSPASPGGAIAAVIFDCDGVLFESRAANRAYHNAILAELGQPPLSPREEELCYVLSTRELYAERFNKDPRALEEAMRVARATDYSRFHQLMYPTTDLPPLLSLLRQRYRLAVASNRGLTLARVIAHFKLEGHFDLTVGTCDVKRPKPHPDLLLYCLDRLALDPPRAVYVGDSVTDRLTAEAAGTRFVGVTEESGAWLRINNLDALPALLETLD